MKSRYESTSVKWKNEVKKAAQIPDHEIPMDYHIYERRTGDARLESRK